MTHKTLSDEQFISDLRRSSHSVELINAYLRSKGFICRPNPLKIRPDYDSRLEYVDDGDIQLCDYWSLEPVARAEVKHWKKKGQHFWSHSSIPFERVIVDEAHKLERHYSLPLDAYYILNPSTTHAIVIPADTMEHWSERRMFDRRQSAYKRFVTVPRNFVRVEQIGDVPHGT